MDSPPNPTPAMEPTLPAPRPTTTATAKTSLTPSSTTPISLAGSKRPAPSLLPPFEPLSSSPGLPRPLKRQNTGNHDRLKYPTPIPTSSTGILSSSPPRRPGLIRAHSERAPLSAVPTVELSENGESLIMGRSSNSSHFQLSANRLVSRVHVKARYIPATNPLEGNKLEIICNGWNGLKLHCQGRTWELFKGDSFTSETEGTEIMVDVQDARVMIQWPKRDIVASLSDSSWDDSPRSQTRAAALLQSSPLRRTTRITSPESPTPAPAAGHMSSSQRLQALLPRGGSDLDEDGIQIYEDEAEQEPELPAHGIMDVNVSMRTDATASFSSDLSDPDDHDPDEENDPIVHSFGPFGADISGRMASIMAKSPKVVKPTARRPQNNETLSAINETAELSNDEQDEQEQPPKPRLPPADVDPSIVNHVVNQLAFSRLSSTPLSTIMQNLPSDARTGLTRDILRDVIEASPCVGIIERQGKDAAGKALESEYYYVPENDNDESRRAAVVDGLRKPSLRNCRKQHKQYYWKRPKTP